MGTVLKLKSGVAGDHLYTPDEIMAVYDSFGLQEEFVENYSPANNALTPAEAPVNEHERMTFIRQYPAAMEDEDLDDTDLDEDIDVDLDDDVDEEIDDVELGDTELDDELEDDDAEDDDII